MGSPHKNHIFAIVDGTEVPEDRNKYFAQEKGEVIHKPPNFLRDFISAGPPPIPGRFYLA
eukprot:11278000-Karenia_brevis.AAC.1